MIAVIGLIAAVFLLGQTAAAKSMGNGWPYYVDILVDWDPNTGNSGDWNVYAQQYYVDTHPGYNVGDFITGCSACLDMSSYDFVFKGNTLQFDETYVPGVIAYPQTHHIVLHDSDGDGVYTGSDVARYDFPSEAGQYIRMDVLEYTVTTENGQVTQFHYVEKEYKKPL